MYSTKKQWVNCVIGAPANFQTISCLELGLIKAMEAFDIVEISACLDLFTRFLYAHTNTQDFERRYRYEMLKVWSSKLKTQSIPGLELIYSVDVASGALLAPKTGCEIIINLMSSQRCTNKLVNI